MCDISITQFEKLDLDSILENVSVVSGYHVESLKSSSRKREIVEARQAFFILSRQILNSTLKSIGDKVNLDHATVMFGLKNEHIPAIDHIVQCVKTIYYEQV